IVSTMRATKGERRRAAPLCAEPKAAGPLLTPLRLAGSLVQRARAADPARDLALDHDRTLGAGALGEHDIAVHRLALRCLQHCHAHLLDRHVHQRRRDLGLLLWIVGQPPRREDRLIERRRLLAHLAGSILGLPSLAHWSAPILWVSPQRDSLLRCTT